MTKPSSPVDVPKDKKDLELMDLTELQEEAVKTTALIETIKNVAIDEGVHKKMLDGLEAHLKRIERRIEVLTLVDELDTVDRAIDQVEGVRDKTKERLKTALRRILADDVERHFDNIPSDILELGIEKLDFKSDHHWTKWLRERNVKTVGDLLKQLQLIDFIGMIGGIGNVRKGELRTALIKIGIPEAVVSTIRALK